MQGLTNGIREASDPATLKQLLSSTRLVLRIFFSMNNPGLTEVRGPHSSCTICTPMACFLSVRGCIVSRRPSAYDKLPAKASSPCYMLCADYLKALRCRMLKRRWAPAGV